MNNSSHIDNLINFMSAQMDGEQVPPTGSAPFNQIAAAIGHLQKSSDKDLQVLGLRTIGAVIARAQGSIAAEAVLRDFIQPGNRL